MGVSMDGRSKFSLFTWWGWMVLLAMAPSFARAATVELSGLFAYGKSEFSDGYKSVQKRYTSSIAFKFTAVSAIEFEYTDSTTNVSYYTTVGTLLPTATKEEITYRDRIYSFNWVQNLVSTKWIIQPYVVIGGGRMTRKYTENFPDLTPPYTRTVTQNVTSGTGGAGLRIFLTRSMALKTEVKTYVPSFRFSKWKENQLMSAGISWVF